MKRSIYLGITTRASMEVIEKMTSDLSPLAGLPQVNTYAITFDYLFQCGVDDLVTFTPENDIFQNESPLLKEKVNYISKRKLDEANEAIEKIFQYYLPTNYFLDEKFKDVYRIKSFLKDLLIASTTKSSLLNRLIVPFQPDAQPFQPRKYSVLDDLLKVKHVLPLELFLPIQYLFQSICQDNITLPHITSSVGQKELNRFQEIFEGKPFKEYKLSHGQLDLVKNKKSLVLADIEKKSENLYKKYFKWINIKKSILSTLPLTAKIIDLSFGKIPGTIAHEATKFVTSYAEKERRIVIYDYSPLAEEFYYRRLRIISDKLKEENENHKKNLRDSQGPNTKTSIADPYISNTSTKAVCLFACLSA